MTLAKKSPVDKINGFFASPAYIATIALISVMAHILSLELVAYSVFSLIAVYVCVLGNDFLPIAPLLTFAYMLPASSNNPGKNAASIFSSTWFYVLVCIVAISIVTFVIRNGARLFKQKSKLTAGIAALCISYLLSGIGSATYATIAGRNLLFSVLQCVCLALPYFLLCGGVDWQKVREDYLSWIGTCTGLLLVCEVLWSYVSGGVIVDGIIDRQKIFTGWGMYNNMGAMLAMMIPFAFSLGHHYKKDWLGILIGFVFLIGTVMTCSRTSLLAAIAIYGVSTLVLLLHSHNRKRILVGLGCFSAVILVAIVLFYHPLMQLFSGFIEKLLDPSSRHIIFAEGWKQFVQAPVFGSSFFSPGLSNAWDFSTLAAFSALFPPRWHNTIVQLLASCGVVGLIAYGFHRFQTVRLFFQRKGFSRICIGCSITVLLACCLLDCHFFNMGPVLFYSVQLAFLEFVPSFSKQN